MALLPPIMQASNGPMQGNELDFLRKNLGIKEEEPKRGGLLGMYDAATRQNTSTGLNPMQNLAASLDALILPEMRMGDAIRQQGASNVAAGNKNRTLEMLRTRGRKDLAEMVERGMISPSEAASQLLSVPKDGRTSGIKEYQQAVKDGFSGTFLEYKTQLAKASASTVTVGGEGMEAFEKEFGKLDAKKLADIDNIGSSAKRSLNQIGRLERILGNIETGMTANAKQIAGNLGIQTEGLDDIQAAAAIINALVPAQRPPGSGVMSDADLELFKQSLPRLLNSPGGNLIILETMRGLAQYDAMGSEIVQRLRNKELTKVEAFAALNNRPDPFANFNTLTVPDQASMSVEEAKKLLNIND